MTVLARRSAFPVAFRPPVETAAPSLTEELLVHLEAQIASARRLLAIVLEQGTAIRQRAIRQVVAGAGALQAEMDRRELLERDRHELLGRAAAELGVPLAEIGFSRVVQLMDVEAAIIATSANAELRGLLAEVSGKHELNRALMAQELSFLNHLLGLAGGTGGYLVPAGSGYRRDTGDGAPRRVRAGAPVVRNRVFDLEA